MWPRAPSNNRGNAEESVFWFDNMEIIWEFYWKSLSMDRVVNRLRGSRDGKHRRCFQKVWLQKEAEIWAAAWKRGDWAQVVQRNIYSWNYLSVFQGNRKKPIQKQKYKQGRDECCSASKEAGGHWIWMSSEGIRGKEETRDIEK